MFHQPIIDEEIQRPTYVEIDISAIKHNFSILKSLIGDKKIMPILKANAYGHGLIPMAKLFQSLKADYLGVAYLEEAIMLRKADIDLPILVLGGIVGDQIPHFIKYEITICASSIEKLDQIEYHATTLGKKALVHLKIDTGMERIGVHYYSAINLLEAAEKCTHTVIEGIFTHLAQADDDNSSYTQLQHSRFSKIIEFYKGKKSPLIHMSNSAATISDRSLSYDMVRIGLALYGINPLRNHPNHLNLRPALSWKTKVVYFKVVKPDHPVSYGSTWKTDELTRMVTIPIGYGDGYMRAMSNKAHVLINGKRYPVRGVICMDQMMVDIGWDTAYNGDEVTLVGSQGNESIAIQELAEWANTISYEILTNINTRVPRIYLDH